MPAPYSLDLRQKVLHVVDRKLGSQREIAELFGVSQSFVERLLMRQRSTGTCAPKAPPSVLSTRKLDEASRQQIRQWVEQQPDLTLAEIAEQLQTQLGIDASLPTICRALQALQLPCKKTLHATERDTERVQQARSDYREQVTAYEVKRLIFVDESGLNIAMTRGFGRAAPGQRVVDAVPKNFGKNLSILGALSCRGLEAVMTVEGAADAAVFRAYVSQVMVPALRPGDVAVMDNLNLHKVAGIQSTIEACGASLLFLPPYSPDWSPIEPCWSKLKTDLRGAKARTTSDLDGALIAAIETITPTDARGWFKHCGYALN